MGSKFDIGLLHTPIIGDVRSLLTDINSSEAELLRAKLVQKSMTLVKNDESLIPITNGKKSHALSISIGTSKRSAFQNVLGKHINTDHVQLNYDAVSGLQASLLAKSKSYDHVFVTLEDMSKYSSKNFGLNNATINLVNQLANGQVPVVLTVFGSPYALKHFDNVPNVLLAYEDDDQTQQIAAQALFGAFEVNGTLPVSVSETLKEGHGLYLSLIHI